MVHQLLVVEGGWSTLWQDRVAIEMVDDSLHVVSFVRRSEYERLHHDSVHDHFKGQRDEYESR